GQERDLQIRVQVRPKPSGSVFSSWPPAPNRFGPNIQSPRRDVNPGHGSGTGLAFPGILGYRARVRVDTLGGNADEAFTKSSSFARPETLPAGENSPVTYER